MKLSALLKPAIDAKMPHEAIMRMVLAFEAEQEAAALAVAEAEEQKREKSRERWRRWKKNQPANVSKRLQTTANDLRGGDARGEVKTSNSEIEPQKENKSAQSARVSDLDEFRAALAGSVDADRIESYVKHRRTKRGQITGHAARLFLGDAQACAMTPSEAVDACISRNWITVKPEYFNGRNARGSPPSAPSMADVFELVGKRQGDERKSEDFSGTGAVVPYVPFAGQRR